MLIGIISDTHDNLDNIALTITWLKNRKIDTLLHCGDICAPITLAKTIIEPFAGAIHLVFGNVDGDRYLIGKRVAESGRDNITIHGELGELEIDGKKIGMNHYPDIAKRLAESGAYDLVCFGHNHQQSYAKVGTTHLVNPGTVAGIFGTAAFAVYDTTADTVTLHTLEELRNA